MTDQRPSNAPKAPPAPEEPDTAAAILSDDEATPGGGGLRGADGAQALTQAGGASPNSPVDVTADAGDAAASSEAARRAVDQDASKPASTAS